ncbi:MAG TPA: hypothetical protein VF789_13620 [Thermoanaerobaculia bacterium]
MSWRMSRRIIGILMVFALTGGLLAAQGDKNRVVQSHRVQNAFPDKAEVEFEHSIITIPLVLHGETEPAEVLKLDAYMQLNREVPVRNGLGYRQFEFTIAAWELHGYSKVLDAYITFKLSDTVKPKSLGVALQKNKDYPAMIVYNAIYDIYIDDVKVGENLAGVAFATGVMEIPPRNITVAFNKPFAFERPRPGRPENGRTGEKRKYHDPECPDGPCPCKAFGPCPCTAEMCLDPGTCEDMESITEDEFKAGVAKARSYRVKGQAKLKSGSAASPGAAANPKKKPN